MGAWGGPPLPLPAREGLRSEELRPSRIPDPDRGRWGKIPRVHLVRPHASTRAPPGSPSHAARYLDRRAAYTEGIARPKQGRPATPEAHRPPSARRARRSPEAVPDATGLAAALPDRSAFSDLYAAHAPRVYRYLLSRTSSPSEAEDLTSLTFMRALAGLDQYRGRGEFGAWLMGIAHHLLLNWYRAKGRRPSTEGLDAALEVPSDIPGPAESLERNEAIMRVRAAVSALAPERQRLIASSFRAAGSPRIRRGAAAVRGACGGAVPSPRPPCAP